jgi:hypothetical protein
MALTPGSLANAAFTFVVIAVSSMD